MTFGITRKRLLGGTAVLVIATAVLLALGVEPGPFFSGLVVGLAAVLVVGVLIGRRPARMAGGGE